MFIDSCFSIDLGEDNEISRFYTPISPVDAKGVVEFVLKEIKDINTLSMSQMLSKLNVKNKTLSYFIDFCVK